MLKRILLTFLFLIINRNGYAQTKIENNQTQEEQTVLEGNYVKVDSEIKIILIQGVVKDLITKLPIDGVKLSIPNSDFETIYSNIDGKFEFKWGANYICKLIYQKSNYLPLDDEIEVKDSPDTLKIIRYLNHNKH